MRIANNENLTELMLKRCATPNCAAELQEQKVLLEELRPSQPPPAVTLTETDTGRSIQNALTALPAMINILAVEKATPAAKIETIKTVDLGKEINIEDAERHIIMGEIK